LNIYTKKKRWKWILFLLAVLIVAASLWYTNILVRKIARDERNNIHIWANAINQKAELVNYTDEFFSELQDEERKRAEILADAFRNIALDSDSDALDFYLKIIRSNTTVPIIVTDQSGRVKQFKNILFNMDTIPYLRDDLKEDFSVFEPIKVSYSGKYDLLYYKDSRIFTELRIVLDDLIESFFSEVVLNSASVPVIITDSTRKSILYTGNIKQNKLSDTSFLQNTISEMEAQNPAIEIDLAHRGKRYIFYKDSEILTLLMYYPYVQFLVIGIFLFIAYILFSSARKSEQNQVWVGLARETAHQLGTPLSSIIGWMELIKMGESEESILVELQKDVKRLEKITERFSKIGSEPILKKENLVEVVYNSIEYLRLRTSSKVKYEINPDRGQEINAGINTHLFEWVVENLCKNAVDAVGGQGNIVISITDEKDVVNIDFTDDGKGIPKNKQKEVFNPGYTSKKRGWGLGLSLAKRIINDYHNGKIFVKSSAIDKGTTFRVILNK